MSDDDPEYRIAYDTKHRKVGCVLIQAIAGTVPSKLFNDFFSDSNSWTLDAGACTIYRIRRSQLPMLAVCTSFDRE